MDERTEVSSARPRYRWPWLLLALLLLGLALAIAWVGLEASRLHRYRDPNPLFDPSVPRSRGVPAQTNSAPPTSDPLANYRGALHGGDIVAGRKLFFEKPEANCGKCHRVAGQGGDAGPALDGIGSRQSREFILESMLLPNLRTTEGFESVIVLLKNGTGCAGLLKSETETELVVRTEEALVTVKKDDVQIRQKGLSPMPEGLGQVLSGKDLRDLVEFVASIKN